MYHFLLLLVLATAAAVPSEHSNPPYGSQPPPPPIQCFIFNETLGHIIIGHCESWKHGPMWVLPSCTSRYIAGILDSESLGCWWEDKVTRNTTTPRCFNFMPDPAIRKCRCLTDLCNDPFNY